MKYLNKKVISDGVIFCGMLVNLVFIVVILYLYVI